MGRKLESVNPFAAALYSKSNHAGKYKNFTTSTPQYTQKIRHPHWGKQISKVFQPDTEVNGVNDSLSTCLSNTRSSAFFLTLHTPAEHESDKAFHTHDLQPTLALPELKGFVPYATCPI